MSTLCVIAVQVSICRPVLVGTLFGMTHGLHFQSLHPLSLIFICTLEWWKHCTMLEIAENVRKFPMRALCGIAAQELICRPVLVGTHFTPTQGLQFQALHPLGFFFICTLHWCKYWTVLAVTTNVRKFPMTALCKIAAHGHICRPVLLGALLAPTQGLHFQELHPLSFLFICTLLWCKHCTVLEVTAIMRKFPITALCEIAPQKLICRPVIVGTLFAPNQGLHFQTPHPFSFLFTCTLHWCNHCTVLNVTTNVRKFPITVLCEIAAHVAVCGPVLVGTLLVPTQGLQFQAVHPFSFHFICTLNWCKHCTVLEVTTEVRKISNDSAMRNDSAGTNLQDRPRRHGFCTDPGFTF